MRCIFFSSLSFFFEGKKSGKFHDDTISHGTFVFKREVHLISRILILMRFFFFYIYILYVERNGRAAITFLDRKSLWMREIKL